VRTVLIRNVALSSAAAAGGESTATALANVSRGLALTESVFSLLSNVKSYLSVGQTFKMVYNQVGSINQSLLASINHYLP
jgi:hypothetical protein